MFFILSTGRSGSTSIACALNRVAGFHAVHEPAPDLILESAGYRYGEVSPAAVRKLLEETRFPTMNGSIYCESNQTLSLIIPELVAVFPQARFIWLVRNGLDVVASAYQKQWYTGHSENHAEYEVCSPIEKAWIDGRIRADKVGEMSEYEWDSLYRFGKCCWYWGYVNQIIRFDLEQHAQDRFFILRLEEMEQRFSQLVAWMGKDTQRISAVERDNVAKRVPFHWTGWSAAQHATFLKWCGEQMDIHYPSWRDVTGENARLFIKPAIDGLQNMIKDRQERLMQLKNELDKIKNSYAWRWIRFLFVINEKR